MHRLTQDQTLNLNSLQIASSCAFQLTDVRCNLAVHYELGTKIETFHSSTEFITKSAYYLDHEKERLQIATNV